MRCPNCHCPVAFEKGLFRGKRCKRCNSTLLVSAYSRTLVLLSLCAAWALLLVTHVPRLFYPSLGAVFGFLATLWLGFPLAFLIMTVMVRTAPRLVSPTLVARHWGAVTTLDLTDDEASSTTTKDRD
jgi:hypothetical protein